MKSETNDIGFLQVTVAPTGSCSIRSVPRLLVPDGVIYTCQNGTWAISASSPSVIETAITSFDSAAILAMSEGGSIPNIVDAPGSGKSLFILGCVFEYTFGTHPFPSINLGVWLGPDFFAIASPGAVFTFDRASQVYNLPIITPALYNPSSTLINAPLRIYNDYILTSGQIVSSVLNSGGADYVPGDTVTVNSDTSATAVITVNTVDGGGAVLTYTLTVSDYADYLVADNVATTATTGIGTGFTIDITEIAQGDGSLTVITYYTTVTL